MRVRIMNSKYLYLTLANILALQTLLVLSTFAQNFDYFLFIQEWPGSQCRTQNGCCFPPSGKPPADFTIHGLLPYFNNGTYPAFCDHSRPYDPSLVSDLLGRMQVEWPSLVCPSDNGTGLWKHEWEKHGTCCESIFHDQHTFFQSVLNLKTRFNLLQSLKHAGIEPNEKSYTKKSIEQAVKSGIGQVPHIECNVDESGNITQLYYLATCLDKRFQPIECPPLPVLFPSSKCDPDHIKFPAF